MTIALFALAAALAIGLSGNAARLVETIGREHGAGLPLVVPAVLGQAAIAGLMLLAGTALAPAMGHDIVRVAAAALLAAAVFLVLRPYPLIAPQEPTRSSAAIGMVVAAFSVRDGSAVLALAAGLLASHLTAPAMAIALGSGIAMVMAARGGASRYGTNARYLAAILMAGAALFIGAFSR